MLILNNEKLLNMQLQEQETFSIKDFEGPLDLLWHLIQHSEINIYEVSLHQITKQYLAKIHEINSLEIDKGAEFIASAASLVWLKSKTLLPKHEQQEETLEEENDPRFEVIHQLIDYCRFRQAAKELSEREQQQSAFFARGIEENEARKKLGIDHLSLEDLAMMFREVLAKAVLQKGIIHEEFWKVSDKIKIIRHLLSYMHGIPFGVLFTPDKSREELIVTFLALLELMKMGEASVAIHSATNTISILVGDAISLEV